MFKKIQEKVNKAIIPGGGSSHDQQNGFLCPVCMVDYQSASALETHYLNDHTTGSSASSPDKKLSFTDVDEDAERFSETSGDQSSFASSSTAGDGAVVNNGAFTCPQCFKDLHSSDALQRHFTAEHQVSANRDGDVLAMRVELADLRKSLQEEKWYSGELKKELERLQSQMNSAALKVPGDAGGDEAAYYLQQIQMLEAGKSLTTQLMLDNEKEISMLKRANEAVQREKDRILERSAQMVQFSELILLELFQTGFQAKELVQLKSHNDELLTQKVALGEKYNAYKEKTLDLVAQLDQRPSEDDVDVLRKELIHAQQLMNDIAEEKEREMDNLKHELQQLTIKCKSSEDSLAQMSTVLDAEKSNSNISSESLAQQLQAERETLAQKEQQLTTVLDENKQLSSSLQEQQAEIDGLRAELAESSGRVQQLQQDQSTNVDKLQQAQTRIAELLTAEANATDRVNELESRLNEQQAAAQSSAATTSAQSASRLSELEQQARQAVEEHESELGGLRQQLQSSNERLGSTTTALDKASSELKSSQDEVQKLRATNETLKSELGQQESECARLRQDNGEQKQQLVSLQRAADAGATELERVKSELAASEQRLERLQTEQASLMHRIEMGDGTQAAMQQLQHENQELTTRLAEASGKLEAAQTQAAQQLAEAHNNTDQLTAQLDASTAESAKATAAVDRLTGDRDTLAQQHAKLLAELNAKTSELQSLRDSADAERTETEALVGKLRQSAKDRSAKMTELAKHAQQLTTELDEKSSSLAAMEQTVASQHDKLSEAIKRLEQAEAKKLDEAAASLSSTEQIVVEKGREIKRLKDELHRLQTANDQTAEQWSGRIEELTTQVTELETRCEHAETQSAESKRQLEIIQAELLQSNDQVRKVEADKQQLATELAAAQSRCEQVTQQQSSAHSEAQAAKRKTDQFIQSLNAQHETELQRLRDELAGQRQRAAEANQTAGKLETELGMQRKAKEQLQESHDQILGELSTKTEAADRANALVRELEQGLAGKDASVEALAGEKQQLRQQLQHNQDTLDHCRQRLSAVQLELDEQRDAWALERHQAEEREATLSAQTASLQSDLDTQKQRANQLETSLTETQASQQMLQSELTDLRASKEEAQQQAADVTAQCTSLREQLQTLTAEREAGASQQTALQQQLAKVNGERQTLDETLGALRSEAETKEAELTNARAELASVESQLEMLTDSLAELRSEKEQTVKHKHTLEQSLKKQTAEELEQLRRTLADEKQTLGDKLLAMENRYESEAEKAAEFKRRFDEIMSALQELGRENQSLQIDLTKFFGRKWVEDSEAVNCTHCAKLFSLIVRKHHCRNCGLIFCNECSAKTAKMSSAKKPVRVCDECHVELNSR